MAFKQSMSSSLTAHFPFSISTQTKETLSTFNRHIRLSETAVIFTGTVEKQKKHPFRRFTGSPSGFGRVEEAALSSRGKDQDTRGFCS